MINLDYYESNYVNLNNKGIIKQSKLKDIKNMNVYEVEFTSKLKVFAEDNEEAMKVYHDFDNENGIIPEFKVRKLKL